MKVKNLLDDNTPKKVLKSEIASRKPLNIEEGQKQLPIEVYSPWANIIIKFKIPDEIFSVS